MIRGDFFFILRLPLIAELSIVILIKLIGLYFLWFMFFSAPIGPLLTEETVAAHLLEP